MKIFRILKSSISDAFKSVFRNFSLSFASVTCTTITLILVSLAIIFSANINSFTTNLEKNLTIVAFLDRDATEEDANILLEAIKSVDNINKDEIVYQDKEEVKVAMQEESEDFNAIMSTWTAEDNHLQSLFILKVNDVKHIGKTASEIAKMSKIDVVKYGEGMVDQLVMVFDFVKKASIIMVVALILVTAFLISNTIKLTIISRKTEIEIMRLIGTSNLVIKLPFLFEGFVLGIIGSIIPVLLTIYGYIIIYDKLGGYLFLKVIAMINPKYFIFYVALILLGIGSVVGIIGSYRAVRKYLKI
ncbi:MAG TPA: permease-like cell division protein FtsX [Bacilli bacterium]|mgnify:CR=1 FL=1|nr:permease-like cell division protein FtsX [Bacilli bacterium]